MSTMSKSESHGRIGEAATYAKCWMNGIPVYHTGGLRSNFAGSDLIVETADPRFKLWIQVKTGAPGLKDHVYLTQCAGDEDLSREKFVADFVVFVNLDPRKAQSHAHDGTLNFEHLSFYVVPRPDANRLYHDALVYWAAKPKRDGSRRKLVNMGVHVPIEKILEFRDAWQRIHAASANAAGPRRS